ncbi:MAG TPA: homoprotocatechuate degradation operon regulator HpaR [Gammaproteobacteria bacterium]
MTAIRRFNESLPMLLLRARETAMARFRPVLHAHGVTEQQWRALRALHDLGELTAAGLAEECAILAPSMTRILRNLSDRGLVIVRRSKSDGRELRVKISAKGKRLVRVVGPRVEEEYAKIREQVRPERLEALYADLRRLIEIGRPTGSGPRAAPGGKAR